jgi:hypothetical protein
MKIAHVLAVLALVAVGSAPVPATDHCSASAAVQEYGDFHPWVCPMVSRGTCDRPRGGKYGPRARSAVEFDYRGWGGGAVRASSVLFVVRGPWLAVLQAQEAQ